LKLHLEAPDGDVIALDYDHLANKLEGLPTAPKKFGIFDKHARHKDKAPRVLKVQMGLACNYSCSYCLQSLEIVNDDVSKLDDAQQFIAQLDTWIEGEPEKLEFWGGEPFVYWPKLKVLVPTIKKRFPNASVTIITNGSVLNQEKIDFIVEHDIGIAISHDGPGQVANRGPDPFQDPEKMKWITELARVRQGNMSFNCVLTRGNFDFKAIEDWIQGYFDFPVQVGLEGVVNVYDAGTLLGSGGIQKDELTELSNEMFYYLATSENTGVTHKADRFIQSLYEERPITAVGQKCGMDRPDQLAVDLKGNVQTCQNTGAKGKHKIGHVDDFDNIELDTATHFSDRPECLACPVVQLCAGSCMYLEGQYFVQSCKNEFAYNMAYFRAALFKLTGRVLKEIT